MNNQQNDDMDRQTLNVAFATQKGGSGKTAITVLVAGYLHYRLGCPLAVIDCDFPQYSLYEMRECVSDTYVISSRRKSII